MRMIIRPGHMTRQQIREICSHADIITDGYRVAWTPHAFVNLSESANDMIRSDREYIAMDSNTWTEELLAQAMQRERRFRT